jgi:hypothetical protein
MAAGSRTPEQIRTSIQETRRELAFSVNDLRTKVMEITDWRGHLMRYRDTARHALVENREKALIGAAVAGFVLGGGLAATVSLIRRRS